MCIELSRPSQPLAFFIQDLRGGGAESITVRLVNGFAERNIDTDLVLVERKGPFLSQVSPKVNIVDLASRRTASSILSLRRYLQQRRPRALVSAMTHINVAAVIAAAAAGVKTRTIVVEHNQFDRNSALKTGPVRLAYRIAPLVYRGADVVAAVSDGVRKTLSDAIRLPSERIEVLYNPVVTPELSRLARKSVPHRWFAERVPVVLAVGRLTRQKNFSLLLEAFALLRARREARLLILGDGELRTDLERQREELGLTDCVGLPGFQRNPYAFMANADVFVMSSDWEGLPTVLIEALACGTPVVSTQYEGGADEILLDGQLGQLVPRGDAQALADALERAIADPGDPAPRIARAHEFGLERSIDRYMSVIQR